MSAFIDYTVNGLVVGNIYGLLAVGLALIFGVANLINFAHGSVYLGHFFELDDATRWALSTRLADEAVPPPHESVLRCTAHPGFALRFGEGWRDLVTEAEGVTITGARGPG